MTAPSPARSCRRFPILLAALLAVGVLAGCGKLSHPITADSEGVYVDAGPITYQVQVSRQLNSYAGDDRQFLAGVTSPAPKADQVWFGVWLWAKNQTGSNATTANSFDIVDTRGTKYYPVAINPQVNPFSWTPQTLGPHGTEPSPGTAASNVPPQGRLLLFKLSNSVYSNRPLTLQIHAPGQMEPSTVSLDL